MIKVAVIAFASVTALLAVASVVCFLLAIWYGDSRWGQTGVVLFFSAIAAGIAAGATSLGMPDD